MNGRQIESLGRIKSKRASSACLLCCMFASVSLPRPAPSIPRLGSLSSPFLRQRRSLLARGSRSKSSENIVTEPIAILGVLEGRSRQEYDLSKRMKSSAQRSICQVIPYSLAAARKPAVNGRLIHPKRVDFDRIRGWLRHYQRFHNTKCAKRVGARPDSLKFIEC